MLAKNREEGVVMRKKKELGLAKLANMLFKVDKHSNPNTMSTPSPSIGSRKQGW